MSNRTEELGEAAAGCIVVLWALFISTLIDAGMSVLLMWALNDFFHMHVGFWGPFAIVLISGLVVWANTRWLKQ